MHPGRMASGLRLVLQLLHDKRGLACLQVYSYEELRTSVREVISTRHSAINDGGKEVSQSLKPCNFVEPLMTVWLSSCV